ncbi:hypothetical protein P691DRAFT_781798 [Macrolepiota fuliginosa MF-IS2]|uniref:Uncharacterized protein n=1 Tax=Macrolepiota fuliginosa MF-IS2 TaxID=1400762 RepID=A0A9P5XBY5_9AGAR|nr:hypothetical protein P691DRAFT_781798 [Macrolepiota fuliginosa MF-IS2]
MLTTIELVATFLDHHCCSHSLSSRLGVKYLALERGFWDWAEMLSKASTFVSRPTVFYVYFDKALCKANRTAGCEGPGIIVNHERYTGDAGDDYTMMRMVDGVSEVVALSGYFDVLIAEIELMLRKGNEAEFEKAQAGNLGGTAMWSHDYPAQLSERNQGVEVRGKAHHQINHCPTTRSSHHRFSMRRNLATSTEGVQKILCPFLQSYSYLHRTLNIILLVEGRWIALAPVSGGTARYYNTLRRKCKQPLRDNELGSRSAAKCPSIEVDN